MNHALLVAFFLALAAACTEVTRTSLPASPPALEELPGLYAVEWRAGAGSANLTSSEVSFSLYPCLALSGQDPIGGGYEYDPRGHFHAEAKTLDGSTKLTLDGTFAADGTLEGSYVVLFLGAQCDAGVVRMRRAPP
jgi:hypothetical protein